MFDKNGCLGMLAGLFNTREHILAPHFTFLYHFSYTSLMRIVHLATPHRPQVSPSKLLGFGLSPEITKTTTTMIPLNITPNANVACRGSSIGSQYLGAPPSS
jgi:hypothetical protein